MPFALAISTPNPLKTSENTMGAALTLEAAKTTPTVILVHGVPVSGNIDLGNTLPQVAVANEDAR
jgi:hypothetical protein